MGSVRERNVVVAAGGGEELGRTVEMETVT